MLNSAPNGTFGSPNTSGILQCIPLPPRMTVTGLHFLDPRVVSKTGNPNFRGIDVRQYSQVEFDAEKKTCSVRCGVESIIDRLKRMSAGQSIVNAPAGTPMVAISRA